MPGPGRVCFREIPLIYRWMGEWRNFSDAGEQVISLDVATAYHRVGALTGLIRHMPKRSAQAADRPRDRGNNNICEYGGLSVG